MLIVCLLHVNTKWFREEGVRCREFVAALQVWFQGEDTNKHDDRRGMQCSECYSEQWQKRIEKEGCSHAVRLTA